MKEPRKSEMLDISNVRTCGLRALVCAARLDIVSGDRRLFVNDYFTFWLVDRFIPINDDFIDFKQ